MLALERSGREAANQSTESVKSISQIICKLKLCLSCLNVHAFAIVNMCIMMRIFCEVKLLKTIVREPSLWPNHCKGAFHLMNLNFVCMNNRRVLESDSDETVR